MTGLEVAMIASAVVLVWALAATAVVVARASDWQFRLVTDSGLPATPGLTVELQAQPGAAPYGMGALVTLRDGERARTRPAWPVASPRNATTLPVHFGLGRAGGTLEVSVDWPSGVRSVVRPAAGAGRVAEGGS